MVFLAGCGGTAPTTSTPTASSAATATAAATSAPFVVTNRLESLGGPNTPAPKPLATKQKVLVGFPSPNEKMSAAFLALDMGEFAKENLDVEFTFGLAPNLATLLFQDRLDVLFGSPSGSILNAISQGIPVRQVAGSSPSSEGSGFYVSTKFGGSKATFKPETLKGQTLGLAPGFFASPATYPVWATLKKGGLTVKDVKIVENAGGAAFIQQLTQGLIVGGNTGAPFGFQIEQSGLGFQAMEFPFPVAGYYSTTTFIEKRRDVATAFWRAVLRTERTYLQGDYKSNAPVLSALAKRLNVDAAVLKTAPNQVFVLWADPTAVTEMQKQYFEAGGVVQYSEALKPEQVIDQSNVADAAQGK